MAGGQLSARQKMINLMYLIFIAMLAMQMDKKVLTAFGTMNETITESNATATVVNSKTLTGLAGLASDQPQKYEPLNKIATELSGISNTYNSYLESVKTEMLSKSENKTDYESMSTGDNVDLMFFLNDKETAKGQEFVKKLDVFKNDLLKLLGPDANLELISKIKNRFNTDEDKRGKKGVISFLKSKFEGFPLIASVTNISKIQSNIKATESEIYTNLVGGQMKSDVSLKNYEAMVVFNKNAYYPGEKLEGKIVLGRKDASLTATKVIVNGSPIAPSNITAGQVNLSRSAGNVGEHELKGKFYFMENGEEIDIEIVGGKYSVIPMPTQAVISADKMNVVYLGLANPMSISIPGIPDNKVTGSAAGLKKVSTGKYMMNPPKGNREIKITASGKLPTGKTVTTSKVFRIKGIPAPTGTLSGQSGLLKMSKGNLVKKTVGAVLKDFVFDLDVYVTGFSVKVPGKPTYKINGTRFDGTAIRAIKKAKKGDVIIIFDIKSKIKNSTQLLKNTSQVSIDITS
ncbi:MAG: gliding motility protein GldM [Flavobacteriaceae bacterium]|nr:gliding motility protein GldM [Flavobacteriaceae bacterium]